MQISKRMNVEAASRRFPIRSPIDQGDEIGYFDASNPIANLAGNLPHFRQDAVTYFVTFRTADSLPQAKLDQWIVEREQWLSRHPEPHTPETKREYFRLFPERIQYWLDAGYGECLLSRPEVRQVVVDALNHFEGNRYRLREWVVMPNHVHVVVAPSGEHKLSQILLSWKSFTAKAINRMLGRTGAFWQKESFDHIVRSPESLERIAADIRGNPAELPAGTYTLSPSVEARQNGASMSGAMEGTRQDAASTFAGDPQTRTVRPAE